MENRILQNLGYECDLSGKPFEPRSYRINDEFCECGGRLVQDDSIVCIACGHFEKPLMIFNTHSDSYTVETRYRYSRITYFKKYLSTFTSGPRVAIDELDQIKSNISGEINFNSVKKSLKKLKLTKYYNSTTTILIQLGVPCPRISNQLFNKYCELFMEFEYNFDHCDTLGSRHNLPHYPFLLYKFGLLMNQDFLLYCPVIANVKSRNFQEELYLKLASSRDMD